MAREHEKIRIGFFQNSEIADAIYEYEDILDKFIANERKSVEDGYYRGAGVPQYSGERHSLLKKLLSQDFTLITEIKHASPAGEYSFEGIDAEKTALEFLRCGSDAISCVVEPKIFNGRLENVPQAKKAGLPVLFKDFVFCEEQIKAARRVGADAILLVVKVADRVGFSLDGMIGIAHENGLEVLLECYDEGEMKRAMKTRADILGINNRDLRTLKVDLGRTGAIISACGGIGKIGKPVISESGIAGRADVESVRKFGVRGVLVGTAIWKAEDIGEKVRELKGISVEKRR